MQSWTRVAVQKSKTCNRGRVGRLAFTDASWTPRLYRRLSRHYPCSPPRTPSHNAASHVSRPIIFSKAKNPNRPTRAPLPAMEKKNAPAAVAPEAIASEPVASEPVASEAVAAEAGASEAVASEAGASEPVASEAGASKRGASVNWASLMADGPLHKIGDCLLACL